MELRKRWEELGNSFSCNNRGSISTFTREIENIHNDFLTWQENIFNAESFLEIKEIEKIGTHTTISKRKNAIQKEIIADEEKTYFIPINKREAFEKATENMQKKERDLQFLFSRCPNQWVLWGSILLFTLLFSLGYKYIYDLFPNIWWYASVLMILIVLAWANFFRYKIKIDKEIRKFLLDRRNELGAFYDELKSVLEEEFNNQQNIQELRVLNERWSNIDKVIQTFEQSKISLEKKMEKVKFIGETLPENISKTEQDYIPDEVNTWTDVRYQFQGAIHKIPEHKMSVLNNNRKDKEIPHSNRINIIRKINITQGHT